MAMALTIVLPVILHFFKISLINKLERYMRLSIQDYDDIPENPITVFWDELQRKVIDKLKEKTMLVFIYFI